MTKQAMLKEMCLELSQADLKAVARSRGFGPESIASPELLQHVFLSEQGVHTALASLTESETLGLHLLNHMGDEVGVEFFKRVYPGLVSSDLFLSYTERFKALFQKVKAQLVRCGILLYGVLPKRIEDNSVLERTRFIFPEEFAVHLPAPFRPRLLDGSAVGEYRTEILRNKLAEILRAESAGSGAPARREEWRWRLAGGDLFFGPNSSGFRVKHLEDWQSAQFEAAVAYTSKGQAKALQPAPLLRYAFSRLRENEWLAPDDLSAFWKMALPSAKTPPPQTVCETGYECGLFERIERDRTWLYRLPRTADAMAGRPPEDFLSAGDAEAVRIDLERTPLAALERVVEVSHLKVDQRALWAAPSLLKISHASALVLADPVWLWLRNHHAAFRSASEAFEQRRGKLIVHENLLVARVNDLGLKVMLENKFAQPGQLVALADNFVAFPIGLLPELRLWMKKAGHVIKTIEVGQRSEADSED